MLCGIESILWTLLFSIPRNIVMDLNNVTITENIDIIHNILIIHTGISFFLFSKFLPMKVR